MRGTETHLRTPSCVRRGRNTCTVLKILPSLPSPLFARVHDGSSKGRRSWNSSTRKFAFGRLFMDSPYQNYKLSCISNIGSLIESANTALENI
ncbi:hypothetical protein Zmor_008517 [Zophobas morio]|uniref:Uncharacterized protein n=1 Tax=Zophobas morio TaxID=2755281 RepID=A0AA38J011_9CUCU|nr:hypothetical protein Zmor_008517 [Zophobas morio]